MIVGTGMDLCEVARMEALLEKYGGKFVARVLCAAEVALVDTVTPAFLAKRFAAKEAVAKALGCGIGARLSFQDIEVYKLAGGMPAVRLSAAAQARFDGISLHISLTQEKTMAAAMAVAVKND